MNLRGRVCCRQNELPRGCPKKKQIASWKLKIKFSAKNFYSHEGGPGGVLNRRIPVAGRSHKKETDLPRGCPKKKQIASWRQKMISRQKVFCLMRPAPTRCCIEMPIPTLYRPYDDPIPTLCGPMSTVYGPIHILCDPYTVGICLYTVSIGGYRVGIGSVCGRLGSL